MFDFVQNEIVKENVKKKKKKKEKTYVAWSIENYVFWKMNLCTDMKIDTFLKYKYFVCIYGKKYKKLLRMFEDWYKYIFIKRKCL